MTEKKTIYADGIRLFTPREGAPDFVKGSLVVTPTDLLEWFNNNLQYGSEYNGKPQLRLQILEGNKGLYLAVDTFKPNGGNNDTQTINEGKTTQDLPF